jgi:hypothetical protein
MDDHMKQAIEDWHNHRRVKAVRGLVRREWPVIAWFISFILIAFGIWQVASLQENLREGLIRSCERNGNPLREAVIDQLEGEIQQSKAFDYSEFFPSVPPERLHTLIREENQRMRGYIEQIQPVDCPSLYPR